MAEKQLERIAVKLSDIEQMILMADKVLDEIITGRIGNYDDNGFPVPDELYGEQLKKDRANGTDILAFKTVREQYDTLEDVLKITAADLEEKLEPIKKRVLGIFRSGILEEWYRFYYYADDSVPDELLFTMFIMRVRDRMIVFGAQRMHDESKERKTAEKENK